MILFSGVTIDGEDSAIARARSTLACRPSTVVSASSRVEFDSRRIDSSRAVPITGIATLSSKLPLAPAQAIVESLPITRAATMIVASGITGLTLPGMIDDPGCRSGMWISLSPVFGPDPIQRRSLQILISETASTRSAPDASTSPSRAPCASKWSAASVIGSAVDSARMAMTFCEKPAGVLIPVPTAVPPSGTSATCVSVPCTRSIASRICRA